MASMEIIPASNDGSISYFNPATKRFHDPVTKRMVPTPAMYKAGAVAPTLKQEETTTTPMNPLDSMMEIFREMRDNLKQLVAQGKRSVGIESKELLSDIITALIEQVNNDLFRQLHLSKIIGIKFINHGPINIRQYLDE